MTEQQLEFLAKAAAAAKQSGHVFPNVAACEAALESAYGRSGLATTDNNLFGMKQHRHPIYGTHILPTREFVGKEKDTQDGLCDGWITVQASWVKYPTWSECFADRMNTLTRLAPAKGFEHYADALAAKDPDTYAREVSAKWSTDPKRADKVLEIYRAWCASAPADLDGEISV
jgi:flagellum-specific peptidoglycan hydrolase FlgJ